MPAGRQGAAGPGNTPARTCPPNGYGLYDVAGKVWEWPATTSPRASAIPPPRPPAHLGIHASTIRPRPRPVPTASPAASSRAGRTCAPRATACATDPPPARADPRTAPPVIWASAACFADRDRRPTPPARLGACAVPHPHPVTQASPPESSSSSVLAGGSDPHDPVPRAADARAGALRDRAVAADGSGRSHLGGPATVRFGTRGRPVVDGLGGRGPLRRRPSPTTEAASPWRSQGTQVTGRGDQSADMAR